jgi:hypothetical protein
VKVPQQCFKIVLCDMASEWDLQHKYQHVWISSVYQRRLFSSMLKFFCERERIESDLRYRVLVLNAINRLKRYGLSL